jgi:hypothetical protein
MKIKVKNPGKPELEAINYGVWLKGNDTDGWNPYAD